MTAKNKEIEAKAKAKAKSKAEDKEDWFEIISGCAVIIGVILLILWFLGFFGGEDEAVVVDDVPESIVDQEQRDWYKSKLEENGGTYDLGCWFWDFQGVFDTECGRLYTNAYYYGRWKDYQFHGYGEMEWAGGQKYEGYWKDDQFHGWGSYEDEEGVINKGHYKNDRRHGRFEITAPNEEMEVVYYSDGEKVEEICEEIGFPKDSSKHEECIFDLVTETLSFEY